MNSSQGHSGTKVQCESKTPEFTKMGEIHELFVLPLLWFGLPGRLLTKGWFWRMFPQNENRNEGTFRCSPGFKNRNQGTFACSAGTKTGTRAHSPKPPFYKTVALLSPGDSSEGPARFLSRLAAICNVATALVTHAIAITNR